MIAINRVPVRAGFLIYVFLLFPIAASSAEVSIGELESAILSSRRSIRSYDLVVDVERTWKGKHTRAIYEIWDEGANHRQRMSDPEWTIDACITEKIGFYYAATLAQIQNNDRSKWPSIRIDEASSIDKANSNYRMHDPMTIMFSSYFFSWSTNFGLEKFINAPNRIDVAESPATWHGQPSIKVSFRFDFAKTRFEYEAVPTFGNSIVAFRGFGERIEQSGRKIPFEVACICGELNQIAPSIWFPKEIHSTQSLDGKVDDDEHLRISFNTVNSPMADASFKIKGLGLPAGVMIVDNTKAWHSKKSPTTHPTLLVWNGATVQPWTSADSTKVAMSAVPIMARPAGRAITWRIMISGFFLFAGAIFMGRYIFVVIKERHLKKT